MAQETRQAIDDAEFSFSAFLPDDETSIVIRGRAIADWCQGFMYGLGLVGEQLTGDASDALKSLDEISQMDVSALEGSEDEEFALVEVIEFLWVAAMLIQSEIRGHQGEQE